MEPQQLLEPGQWWPRQLVGHENFKGVYFHCKPSLFPALDTVLKLHEWTGGPLGNLARRGSLGEVLLFPLCHPSLDLSHSSIVHPIPLPLS